MKKKKIEIHKKEAYSSSSAVDTIIICLTEKNNSEENIYTLKRGGVLWGFLLYHEY